MDRPDLDAGLHATALDGLARLNRWSASTRILWGPIARLAAQSTGPLRVLDVASGAGDLPIRLWRRAKRAGVDLDITGCDISPTAVAYATSAAKKAGVPVRFVERDVLAEPSAGRFDGARFDVVTCSLFLHHLPSDDAVTLLRTMAGNGPRLLLVNDLVRGPMGKLLADVACRVLSRSPVVHVDGPRSVEGAFTIGEARELCSKAGLEGATVSPRWPCRMLIQWTNDR